MFVAVSYTYLGGGVQPLGSRGLRALVFNPCVVLRVPVYVIRVVRARLQAGGAPFSVGKLYCAMQAFVRCRFAYLISRTCAHVSTLKVRPFLPRSMKLALCSADIGVMMGANKQTQWFLVPHFARYQRNLKLQERELSVMLLLGRRVHVYWRYVCKMGAPLVHDICVRCVECALC